MIDKTYHVTRSLDLDGKHFVHTEDCQVFPQAETVELGAFEGCAPALLKARETRDPVEACALCCPRCHKVEAAEVARAAGAAASGA